MSRLVMTQVTQQSKKTKSKSLKPSHGIFISNHGKFILRPLPIDVDPILSHQTPGRANRRP